MERSISGQFWEPPRNTTRFFQFGALLYPFNSTHTVDPHQQSAILKSASNSHKQLVQYSKAFKIQALPGMPTSTAAIADSGDSSKTTIGSSVEDSSLKESGSAQSQSCAQNEVQELEKFGNQISPCQLGEVHSSVVISSDQEKPLSFGNDQNIVSHDGVFNIAVSASSKFGSHVDTRDIDNAVRDAVLREQVCTFNMFQFFKFL